MKAFKRCLRVVLIKDGPEYKEEGSSYISTLTDRQFREISPALKVSVEIEVSKRTCTDNGKIKIWNPNRDTIDFISGGQNGIAEVYAGYGDYASLIFRGAIGGSNIVAVDTDGPDTILKYTLGSYLNKIQSAFFRGSFAGSTPAREIIRTALSKTGIAHSGLNEAMPDDSISLTDFSYSGSVTELIKKLQESYGLNSAGVSAYYENGLIRFANETGGKTFKVITVSAETGLIDTPRWENKHREKRFKFKSVVNPDIIRGSVVEIISIKNPSVNGLYSVDQIEYELSNTDGDFRMECEVSERKK